MANYIIPPEQRACADCTSVFPFCLTQDVVRIWPDGTEAPVPEPEAATQLSVLPSLEEVKRLYKHSTVELAFWKAMIAAPVDDLPRLVYADWLDERSNPGGGFLRGSIPFALNNSVGVGGDWEHRNSRSADWRLVVNEFRAFLEHGGFRFVALAAGYSHIALARHITRFRPRSVRAVGEWQCLSISTASAEPAPPFVNYLLIKSAIKTAILPPPEIPSRPVQGDCVRVTVAEFGLGFR